MATASHHPSYVSELITQLRTENENGSNTLSPADENAVVWTATSLYAAAAADTTVITLTAFTLAMTLFPSVQRKAQAEIDGLLGSPPARPPADVRGPRPAPLRRRRREGGDAVLADRVHGVPARRDARH
jgi:hypothetical protein